MTANVKTKEKLIFNRDIKNQFLNTYDNEDSQRTYKSLFEKTAEFEEKFDKDLYQFSIEEIEGVLGKLNPLNNNMAEHYGRIITAYIQWAILNKKTTNRNELKEKTPKWFEQFVIPKKLYFTLHEIEEIEDHCENAQDAVVIRLGFEGLGGLSYSEITSLKKDNVKYEQEELIVYNLDNDTKQVLGERVVELLHPEYTLRLIRQANQQSEYWKSNGAYADGGSTPPITKLVDNEYVVRCSSTYTFDESKMADIHVLFRRVKAISKSLEIPYFTLKNIQRSGMLYLGKQLLDARRLQGEDKLTMDDYRVIAKRFNYNAERSVYSIKKFCNETSITELYGN